MTDTSGTYGASVLIGESFTGSGPNAAHLNTVLGRRGSAAEAAWATALATPRAGYAPFVAVLQPSLPVKPLTLFVNKADIRGDTHATMTWGAAQAGVAGGVADAVAEGIIPKDAADDLLLIAAVWVDWAAYDADEVYRNNRAATRNALAAGAAGEPTVDAVLAARAEVRNPFYTPSVEAAPNAGAAL
ncbi:5,6,7,8-tetrahydromethanopterin hydro-lyase [Streptacidiphilus sp. MAP12-16]|uniref:formaldehyde-activating enzyme n=1 Tax=Streptacidiphilus sp. MAP12-16 TaxID=3156300 RepID=UPI00351837CA